MSIAHTCIVCDALIDPYGRDGVTCARCKEPCQTCGGNVAYCNHPLRAQASRIEADNDVIRERTAEMIGGRAA